MVYDPGTLKSVLRQQDIFSSTKNERTPSKTYQSFLFRYVVQYQIICSFKSVNLVFFPCQHTEVMLLYQKQNWFWPYSSVWPYSNDLLFLFVVTARELLLLNTSNKIIIQQRKNLMLIFITTILKKKNFYFRSISPCKRKSNISVPMQILQTEIKGCIIALNIPGWLLKYEGFTWNKQFLAAIKLKQPWNCSCI